uniref:Uncharacterized protein n=1 Tax=Anguilla anguilla TaxID=7936 RepID=A0A0E9W1Z3_ANGAN
MKHARLSNINTGGVNQVSFFFFFFFLLIFLNRF